MHFRTLTTLALICIVLNATAKQQTSKKLDSIMQLASDRGIFNGNILIAKKGNIIYQKSLGYADAAKTRKLTSEARFDIGSVSKEFNGAAIMLLKERGLLSLDDPIDKHLKWLPEWSSKVKVRHLLNYTSGIPNLQPGATDGDNQIQANLKQLTTLQFEPGTAYIYNHYNVYLQRRIVEYLSGMTYKDFLKKNIFDPCQMTGAEVDLSINNPKMAQAYDQNFQPSPYLQTMSGWTRLTAKDLFLWTQALYGYKILNQQSFKKLSQNFSGGESSIGTTGTENGLMTWHRHQGSNSNYEALIYSDLKTGLTVVMMTNNQQMKLDGIKNALFAAINEQKVTVPKKSFYLEIREKALLDVDQAMAYYQQLKKNEQDRYDFSFEIGDLISTGKYLLRRNMADQAIKVFQKAVALKASSRDIAYGYELIGEAYVKKKDNKTALLYYHKAVTINPDNKNSQGMIKQLESM